MDTSSATHAAALVAAGQHGRITHAQLVACGFTDQQIKGRARTGWLHREHLGVFALGHPGANAEARLMSAQLAFGPDAALSHRSAASIWRIVESDLLEVTLPTGRGCRARDGILPHRAPLPATDVCWIHGLRLTTLLRTLLDLAAVLDSDDLLDAFEEAQVIHRLRPAVLGERVVLRGGFRGNGKLRDILAEAVDPGLVQSRLELHFFKLCARHGIERPLTNVGIGAWNVDFLWPRVRVVVETDGRRWHHTAHSRRRDTRKDAWLRAHGYVVIRLRWADVHQHEIQTAATVRGALSGG